MKMTSYIRAPTIVWRPTRIRILPLLFMGNVYNRTRQ